MLQRKSLWHLAAVSVVVIAGFAVPTGAQAQMLVPSQAGTSDQHGEGAKASKAKKSKRAAQPGTPFECTGKIYESAGAPTTQLYEGTPGLGSVSFTPLGPASGHYNAIGINPVDHFMYAIGTTNDSLLRISNDGSITDLGPVHGLPPHGFYSYNIGTFDDAGNYYVAKPLAGSVTEIYVIDVTTQTMTATIPVVPPGQFSDWALADDFLWGASPDGSIVRIDQKTGAASTFPKVLPATTLNGYGGAFTYGNGDLGFVDNGGFIRRVAVTNPGSATPAFTLLSTQTAPAVSTNVDATSCFGAPTDLSVTNTSSPVAYTPGQKLTYTITVKNNGPNQSSGYIVNDTIPAALKNPATSAPGCTITGSTFSCTGAALAPGSSDTITITGTVDESFTGVLTDTATVTGNEADSNPSNNTDTVNTPRNNPPRRADLGIDQAGPAKVTEGDAVTYTLKVTNNGPNDSTGYTVTDTLPTGLQNASTTTPGCTISGSTVTCTGGPLADGASNTITIKGTVGPGTNALTNTASVTGKDVDPDPGNNTDTISSPRTQVDLDLQATGPARVLAGDQVSYDIKIINNGPDNSTGYTVTDLLPAGLTNPATSRPGCSISGSTLTCTGTSLAAGDSVVVTVTGTVARNASSLTSTATVVGKDVDPDPGNNVDTLTIEVEKGKGKHCGGKHGKGKHCGGKHGGGKHGKGKK
ncbi:hypothetical protein ACFCYB_19755 [Streptomyces sp. NPDC056309]|uniref:DUF6923 family protein n=1 Tax=unclassified Streptomyces TaxID=2593676 RepID=UPI0035D7F0F5